MAFLCSSILRASAGKSQGQRLGPSRGDFTQEVAGNAGFCLEPQLGLSTKAPVHGLLSRASCQHGSLKGIRFSHSSLRLQKESILVAG